GEGRGRLPELDVAEPDVVDGLQDAGDPGLILEELEGCLDRHLQDLRDVVALPQDLEGLPVVALSAAFLARDVDVGEEVHLDLDRAVALARLAPPAGDVERAAPRLVAPGPGLGRLGEELTYQAENPGVSSRIRAWGAPDRSRLDVDARVDELDALDPLVPAGDHTRPVHLGGQPLPEDLLDQRRLARAGHTGDGGEHA